jgi:hypothetical protein
VLEVVVPLMFSEAALAVPGTVTTNAATTASNAARRGKALEIESDTSTS